MKKLPLKLSLILTAGILIAAICTGPIPGKIYHPKTTEALPLNATTVSAKNVNSTALQSSLTRQTKQQALKRMFLYDKKLYIDTGEVSTAGRCGVMDGKILKTVPADQIPSKELQSNFGKGYYFQIGSRNRLEVCIDDTWHIFAYNENNFDGVTMKVKRNTAKSAVLIIKNTRSRDVLWGDQFLLEKKNFKTGEWYAVPYKNTDFAFHCIAWFAKKDTSAKWKADWSYMYGTLKPGTYRIVKELFEDGKAGERTEYYTLSAKFRVEK